MHVNPNHYLHHAPNPDQAILDTLRNRAPGSSIDVDATANYIESTFQDLNVSASSTALLDSYRRAEEAAANTPHGNTSKTLKQLRETAADQLAFDAVMQDTTVDAALKAGTGGAPTTFSEVFNKKDPRYKALAPLREKMHAPRTGPDTSSYHDLAKRAVTVYGAIGTDAEGGAGVAEKLIGSRLGGTNLTKDLLQLKTGGGEILSSLDPLVSAANPTLLADLRTARNEYNGLQADRTRKLWFRRTRNKNRAAVGDPSDPATPAGKYRDSVEKTLAAIDGAAGPNDEEKAALKTLVLNELSINDAVDQHAAVRGNAGWMAKTAAGVARGLEAIKVGKMPVGNILMLGAIAGAAAGIALGTGGLALPAAVVAAGSFRLFRGGLNATIATGKQFNTLHLPSLGIIHPRGASDNMNAQTPLSASEARVAQIERRIKTTKLLGAVALAAGGAGIAVHILEHGSGVVQAIGDHNNSGSAATGYSPNTTESGGGVIPGTSIDASHDTSGGAASGVPGYPTYEGQGAGVIPGTPVGENVTPPVPTPDASGGAGAGTGGFHDGPGASGPGVSTSVEGGPSGGGAAAPTPPDFSSAINSLNEHGFTTIKPGEGFYAAIDNLKEHAPGFEHTQFTQQQLYEIQREAGRKILAQGIKFPDGTPVAYLAQGGDHPYYGFGNTGQLPKSATQILLQTMQEHAGHGAGVVTSAHTEGLVTGANVGDVAHNLVAAGDANITSGEGWDQAIDTMTQHTQLLHNVQFTPAQLNSIHVDAAREMLAQHVTFANGDPVAYVMESGDNPMYGISSTGPLPEKAVQIVLQTAQQHAEQVAHASGVNLTTLGSFLHTISPNGTPNFNDFVDNLPNNVTSYQSGENLNDLLGPLSSQVGINLTTDHSLNAIAQTIDKVQPGLLSQGTDGAWTFQSTGQLTPAAMTRILQSLGVNQGQLDIAS